MPTELPIENPFVQRLAVAQNSAEPPVAVDRTKKPLNGLLAQITSRKRKRPIFGVIYGPSGIGKSTFGSNAPKPVFLQIERGLDQITVPKLPIPKDFATLYQQIDALDKEEHDFQTIVLDSAGATEVLIWQRVCSEGKVKSLEEYGGGYGKGYARGRELWAGLLSKLSDMSERFNVLILAHSVLRSVADPTLAAAYDMYRMQVHDKSAEIIRQMVDLICFVNLDVSVTKETQKAKKGRAIVSGDRLMWTQPGTGYEAKNRYDLESPMEFSWEALETGINNFYSK